VRRPMNLLVCCGAFHPCTGGAESLFFDLAGVLAARGHDVTVLTRRLADSGGLEEIDGFRIVRLRWPVPYETLRINPALLLRSPQALYRTWSLVRSRRIATVCIGLLDMSAMYLLALHRVLRFRLVTYLHGGEIRDLPHESPAFRILVERCLTASDAVVAVSPSLADAAADAFPAMRDKLVIIPNGIDLDQIAAAPATRRQRPYILYLGRLARDKNVRLVLDAFARAAARIPEVDLVLAGTGPEHGPLMELAHALDLSASRIEFLGAVDRVHAFGLAKGALFLVLASPAESHPLSVIEACIAGKAVVGPRVAGLEDMIEDGVNGALFPPGDAGAFAELMVAYAGDADLRTAIERRLGCMDWSHLDIRKLAHHHLRVLDPNR
jgi:glycosyltransferase involved in cell wall biosynthesis